MPTALWIAHVHVTDAEAYGRYAKEAGPAIAAHGGVFLARGGRYVQLEGNDRARNVVARFPSLEKAVECYNSPAYQAALAHANRLFPAERAPAAHRKAGRSAQSCSNTQGQSQGTGPQGGHAQTRCRQAGAQHRPALTLR